MPSLSSVYGAVDADILSQAAGKARRPIGKMISCSCLMFSYLRNHATEPIDCKGGLFAFSMFGTNPHPVHTAYSMLSTSQSRRKLILRGEI